MRELLRRGDTLLQHKQANEGAWQEVLEEFRTFVRGKISYFEHPNKKQAILGKIFYELLVILPEKDFLNILIKTFHFCPLNIVKVDNIFGISTVIDRHLCRLATRRLLNFIEQEQPSNDPHILRLKIFVLELFIDIIEDDYNQASIEKANVP